MRILIIDHTSMLHVIGYMLAGEYQLYLAGDLSEANKICAEVELDLIIIDLTVQNAAAWWQRLSKERNTLILVVSEDPQMEVVALQAKADNFLLKPFLPEQLLARCHIVAGDLHVLPLRRQAWVGAGTPIRLSPLQFAFLEYLARNANQICTYEALQERLWPRETQTRPLLKLHMRSLRRRFPTLHIENISGVGYRLIVQEKRS